MSDLEAQAQAEEVFLKAATVLVREFAMTEFELEDLIWSGLFDEDPE